MSTCTQNSPKMECRTLHPFNEPNIGRPQTSELFEMAAGDDNELVTGFCMKHHMLFPIGTFLCGLSLTLLLRLLCFS